MKTGFDRRLSWTCAQSPEISWHIQTRKKGDTSEAFETVQIQLSYSSAVRAAEDWADKRADLDTQVVEIVGVVWQSFKS